MPKKTESSDPSAPPSGETVALHPNVTKVVVPDAFALLRREDGAHQLRRFDRRTGEWLKVKDFDGPVPVADLPDTLVRRLRTNKARSASLGRWIDTAKFSPA